jgi:hypothetical protein
LRKALWLLPLVLSAACEKRNGTGDVSGAFFVKECRPLGDRPLEPYAFTAGAMSTQRNFDVLLIVIQDHMVRLEETDGLTIRIPSVQALRSNTTRPLILPVSLEHSDINASLSLFDTCPGRPTLSAVQGTLRLDKFTIAADPADTGDHESLAGTLTATVVSADVTERVGNISADFDFLPQPMPLTQ